MKTSTRLFCLGAFCIAMAGGCIHFCVLSTLALLAVGLLSFSYAIDFAMGFD